ncbi:metal-dependent hydrolase [Massilia solisilvae]|uniref:Metal-dependent hydrolase n=1 Tax=Massilia solisilvae TaxID=1811225 RepID=A0ABT2BJ12_9BURK|nr:metal-dependent hydrolase [Massilia solisilvae]MCS0608496.1 metal-dependent hydrolase [Massilia solisilvae]
MSSLTVRKLDVDLSRGFSRRWLADDAYRTQFFNALSMTFPIGEQMFIDSLRAVPPARLSDPALAAEVRDFVGQEASHRFAHIQYNAQLAQQGFGFTLEKAIARRVRRIAKLDVRSRVAITCALEHYTAVLADGVLRHPEWLEGADPALHLVWTWHAVEETEHKAVAFDVYRAAGGGYVRRVLWFVHASLVFWFDVFLQTAFNLKHDGALWQPRTWASAARMWFGRRGVAWHLFLPCLHYLRPSFHPWQHDNRALAAMWLASNISAYRAVGRAAPAPGAGSA